MGTWRIVLSMLIAVGEILILLILSAIVQFVYTESLQFGPPQGLLWFIEYMKLGVVGIEALASLTNFAVAIFLVIISRADSVSVTKDNFWNFTKEAGGSAALFLSLILTAVLIGFFGSAGDAPKLSINTIAVGALYSIFAIAFWGFINVFLMTIFNMTKKRIDLLLA